MSKKMLKAHEVEKLLNEIAGITLGVADAEAALGMIQDEIARFEQEHRIGDHAPEPDPDRPRFHHFSGVGTLCVIPIDEGACAVGFAAQHPTDAMNRKKGRIISEGRARTQRVGSLAAIRDPELVRAVVSNIRKDAVGGYVHDLVLLQDDIEQFLRGTSRLLAAENKRQARIARDGTD